MASLRAFTSYDLRTTDTEAAQAFYTDLLGWQVQPRGDSRVFLAHGHPVGQLVPLPERARAQGAPAHWLGHIDVEDVEATARRFTALGAQQLGPPQPRFALLKDPQGAVLALSSGRTGTSPGAVAWHELHTTDREAALACYSELFGWKATGAFELPPPMGTYQRFTWEGSGKDVGGMLNSARNPAIHTHWLFYFTVKDLDAALSKVREHGGRVLNGPNQVPSGDRVAQCEDPQGAAFALRQPA